MTDAVEMYQAQLQAADLDFFKKTLVRVKQFGMFEIDEDDWTMYFLSHPVVLCFLVMRMPSSLGTATLFLSRFR